MDAQKHVEVILTGSLHTTFYVGKNVYKDLSKIAEMLDPAAQKALDFIQAWQLILEPHEIYRRSTIQDNYIELWSLLSSLEISSTDQPMALQGP